MSEKNTEITDVVENEEDLHVEDETVVTEEETSLEETAASDTLKPGGAPGETRAQTLATFTQLLSQLKGPDLTHLFQQVQDLYGPNKAPGAVDKSGSNESTIKAKSSAAPGAAPIAAMPMQKLGVKEDVEEMLEGEDLSEEFKERAEVIFEAALNTRINLEMARLAEEYDTLEAELKEHYETQLESSVNEILEDLTEKTDQYLNYAVEEWMEENKLAIENSLRAEIAENFIQGLHNLFSEHYIKVPEESFDIVAEMKTELDELRANYSNLLDEKIQLEYFVNEATIDAIVSEASVGLSDTQVEKMKTLAEGIQFTDEDSFRQKLDIVKEQYFTKKKEVPTGLITESIDGSVENTETNSGLYPGMDKYVKAIGRR